MSEENKADQQEPTMEEILASIRRILSENDEERKQAEAEAEPATEIEPRSGTEKSAPGDEAVGAAPAEEEEDVFDLTDRVEAPNEEEKAEGAPDDDEGVLILGNALEPEKSNAEKEAPAGELEPEPESAPPALVPPPSLEEGLVSAATAAAATAAFISLIRESGLEPNSSGNLPLGEGNTLEDLVRDMLRPLLKEWLDENLPGLVDHLVRKEIQRIVHRAEDL